MNIEDKTTVDVHVSNVGANPNMDQIRAAFERHAKVEDVRLITDKETGKVKDFAFVSFVDKATAEEVVNSCSENMMVGDLKVKVELAKGMQDCFNCKMKGHMAKHCRRAGGGAYVPEESSGTRGGYQNQGGYGGGYNQGGYGRGQGGGYGGGYGGGPGGYDDYGYGGGYGSGGYGQSSYGGGGGARGGGARGGGRGGIRGGGQSSFQARPGDWTCEKMKQSGEVCGNVNWARRDKCNSCEAAR